MSNYSLLRKLNLFLVIPLNKLNLKMLFITLNFIYYIKMTFNKYDNMYYPLAYLSMKILASHFILCIFLF